MRIPIAMLALALLAGCAAHHYPGNPDDPPMMIGENDAGRTIELARGKRMTLRLVANHMAGYSWMLTASGDGKLEQLSDQPFYTTEKAVPGEGGAEYWPFRATQSGKAELRFEYRRPWETDKPAAKTVAYTVNVR